MGFWLIALALLGLIYLLIRVFDLDFMKLYAIISVFVIIPLFFAGIFSAPAGYEETGLVREVILVSSNDASDLNYQGTESYVTKELCHISKSYGNQYKYIIYYEVPSSLAGNSTKVYTREEIIAYSSDVTIIENSSQVAIMQEYITRPKKTFWSFGVGQTTREYIFNIPKNTVVLVEAAPY